MMIYAIGAHSAWPAHSIYRPVKFECTVEYVARPTSSSVCVGNCRASYIELQRIDATTRSPIYAHFGETLTGVETLRAYGFQERFALANERKIDHNHRCLL